MKNFLIKYSDYLVFAIALIAGLGSLYFQYVEGFPPCVLCWFQRVFMYPLVFLSAVAIISHDEKLPYYALPLSFVGLGVSVYHNLLYYKIIPEALAPCTAGVSCTTKFIEWFGFVTIPFLSFAAFLVITILMVVKFKTRSKYE